MDSKRKEFVFDLIEGIESYYSIVNKSPPYSDFSINVHRLESKENIPFLMRLGNFILHDDKIFYNKEHPYFYKSLSLLDQIGNAIKNLTPTVFISYSYDSKEFEQWVLMLSSELRKFNINVLLDKFILNRYCDNITLFLNMGIKQSDIILIICTPEYVQKANLEKDYRNELIINQKVYLKNKNKQILLVLRKSNNNFDPVPWFLMSNYCIDFRDDFHFHENFNNLLKSLFNGRQSV